jgi:hypothetical protein
MFASGDLDCVFTHQGGGGLSDTSVFDGNVMDFVLAWMLGLMNGAHEIQLCLRGDLQPFNLECFTRYTWNLSLSKQITLGRNYSRR